jgi:hypothetical protein
MENQNENASNQQGSDVEALEALFDKYKKRDEKKKRFSKEELLAKFFNPRKDTEIFRALPKIGNELIIEEAYFHKVQAGKAVYNTANAYCLAKNNPKVQSVDKNGVLQFTQDGKPLMVNAYCPLCAKSNKIKSRMNKSVSGKKREELTSDQDKAIFDNNKILLTASNKFESKLYYIIRGIDRGAEKDGVKFWRFKHNFKRQGIHDKLVQPIIHSYYKQSGKVYSDVEDGIDLLISVVDNSIPGSSRTYRDVSSIIPRYPASKLSNDPLILKQWLDDKTSWRDVFKPKKAPGIDEVKYLELAAEERVVGQTADMRNTPYYDEDVKKWVFPNHPDLEIIANTKNQNLDAEDIIDAPDDDSFVGAALSVVNQSNSLDITQMSSKPLNEVEIPFKHNSTNIASNPNGYDDLPF